MSTPQPREVPAAPQATIGTAIGMVRVTATTLNVRREASSESDIVAQVRKGERLALLATNDEWMRVRLSNGEAGWVAAQYVIREGARKRRPGCAADSNYRLLTSPTPSFSDAGPHGLVTVEANVDVTGKVTSTRVIGNTTGDETLGITAEREIRNAKFAPPIRDCVAKPFIFTYKRAF